jgi:hypothetical protein
MRAKNLRLVALLGIALSTAVVTSSCNDDVSDLTVTDPIEQDMESNGNDGNNGGDNPPPPPKIGTGG